MRKLWCPESQTILLVALIATLAFGNAIGATFLPEQGTATDKDIEKILSRAKPGQNYVQIDDMRFLVSQLKRSGFSGPRWTDGEVFYEFDAGLDQTQRDQWLAAAHVWDSVADLQFIERTSQANYIQVFSGDGNWSYVGMVGGEQLMSIASWSSSYTIVHEIGHVLGQAHEHSRPDRDTFVSINPDNIQDDYEDQFAIVSDMELYGVYDLDSVMHYDACSFSNDCPPGFTCDCANFAIAILPPNEGWQDQIGQRDHLSTFDVQGMSARYFRGELLVSNVQVARQQFTALYDITYDLETVGDIAATVSLSLSTDSGTTYPNLCATVAGDVGAGVLPGTGNHIVWNAGADFPGLSSPTCRLRVTADDGQIEVPAGFVAIPPGTFVMGSPTTELGRLANETQHQVTLTHGIYVQTTEVTNQQYRDMAQWAYDNGYVTATTGGLYDKLDGSTQLLKTLGAGNYEITFSTGVFSCINPTHPVKYVTWYGSVAYCDWLSLQQGVARAYNHSTWQCNAGNPYTAQGYRLPTEAEWEYACRAGSTTAFANGPITYYSTSPVDPNLNLMGWYGGNAGGWTHSVAQKAANSWGLLDMHGSIFEWCNDWYGTYGGTVTDPVGAGAGSGRVIRGGDWSSFARDCRSAVRYGPVPDYSGSYVSIGFRPVRSAN